MGAEEESAANRRNREGRKQANTTRERGEERTGDDGGNERETRKEETERGLEREGKTKSGTEGPAGL